MSLNDFLSLRPTHIQQKLGFTKVSILPLHTISKLQTFKVPIIRTYDFEALKGWFWSAKSTATVVGLSFDVTQGENLEKTEKLLKKLVVYLEENRIDIPFFIEAEIDLNQMDKRPETVFYYLLQSYFTSFNLRVDITDIKNEIENLNSIYKPIRDLELGLTLSVEANEKDVVKYLDDFVKTLSIFKINPNYLMVKDNNYDLKNAIKQLIDVKLSEDLNVFNNFSSNIYINEEMLRTGIDESLESQVYYSSRKLFKGLNLNNTVSKLLMNLYRLGDQL